MPTANLSRRIADATAQAIRKEHALTGTVPARARTASVRVRFDDGTAATFTVTLKRVDGGRRA